MATLLLMLTILTAASIVEARRSTSLSSSLISGYYQIAPHDTRLYDTLGVCPNATLLEIQRSWRRRSILYHPDKQVRRDPSQAIETRAARRQLDTINRAYDTLNNDQTRLLYHRYGIAGKGGSDDAVRLLLLCGGGPSSLSSSSSSSHLSLARIGESDTNQDVLDDECRRQHQRLWQDRWMELLGYPPSSTGGGGIHNGDDDATSRKTMQRRGYLVMTITERIRPMVEGSISQEIFVNDVARECEMLKRCPFGSQILRCIGCAYRIEGYRARKRMTNMMVLSSVSSRSLIGDESTPGSVTDGVMDAYRDAKKYTSAALAGGKLMLTERRMRRLVDEEDRARRREDERRREEKGRVPCGGDVIDYDDDDDSYRSSRGDHINFESNNDYDSLEEELRRSRRQKTYSALLLVHQMEALWKITKIDLDRTIREACRWVLSHYGEGSRYDYCHPPSSPPPPPPPPLRSLQQQRSQTLDGWVGIPCRRAHPPETVATGTSLEFPLPRRTHLLTGEVVPMEVRKLRAAAALILVGDIFVQSSKEGTVWEKR